MKICDDEICNNRGTCIGSKDTNFCICKLGYTGMHCENTPCDSTRDCNGKGLCIGTSSSHTCMCQLGFTGEKCENDMRK
uniref:EGF-like domain-containing protein n=1 Tax=Elaeophora elaphi TaxID=1147741 RepID=A0A0R3RUA4_9BILA